MSQPVSIRPADGSVDWPSALARLERLLRIRTTPIGMKLFETVEEMEAVEKSYQYLVGNELARGAR